MKVLFVATRKNCDPTERELYEMDFMNELLGFRRSLLDLGLLTVAACTPKDVAVEVHDEYLAPIPYDTDADLIALSAKTSAVARAYEVAREFRKRGKKVVLGGIHASLRPDEALEHVDYVVLGEAERTWPRFVELFAKGEAPRKMEAGAFPPMNEIPVPAWERIPYKEFLFHQLQSTRGCPFTCRFCSVPDISGQEFRCKPVEKIVEEIRAFPSSGPLRDRMKALYFVDDNFLSKPKYTIDLLKALAELRKKGELVEWSAETTLNVASTESMLDLFAEAGCSTLIIGFESVSEATLLAMDKKINFALSYHDALERIHSRGMSVVGNFIVGFDTDTIDVFRDIRDFVDKNNILYPFVSILTPMPGTKLHEEVKEQGRLDHFDWGRYDTRHVVFEPKNMTREQLMDGYIWLYEQLYATDTALDRLSRYWKRYGKTEGSSWPERAFIQWRLRKFRGEVTPRFERYLDEGWRRLTEPGVSGDLGQLLYFYDSTHFVEFLRRHRTRNYAEHARMFSGELPSIPLLGLERKQWDRKRKLPLAR